ncbi:casein kinase II, regulatory subunit [Chytriomyces sp. MP71]|nr:casein kinase II, regulatory subunit [Chytriomyces sp. MP71]
MIVRNKELNEKWVDVLYFPLLCHPFSLQRTRPPTPYQRHRRMSPVSQTALHTRRTAMATGAATPAQCHFDKTPAKGLELLVSASAMVAADETNPLRSHSGAHPGQGQGYANAQNLGFGGLHPGNHSINNNSNNSNLFQNENEDDDDNDDEDEFLEDTASSSGSSGESSAVSWIYWYCSLPGHEFFVEVPEDFIKDDFNLTGLNTLVLLYNEALDMILDLELDPAPTPAQLSLIESSAEMLYGLIHQRFLLTKIGLGLMADRLADAEFGACPREGCGGAPVLPCGRSDQPSVDTVKMFCVRCCDLYHPREAKFQHIDGAFFGTTFPHLLYNTYPQLIPPVLSAAPSPLSPATAPSHGEGTAEDDEPQPLLHPRLPNYRVYVPRIFGFRLSEQAVTGPRMGWMRWKDGVDGGRGVRGHVARTMEVGIERNGGVGGAGGGGGDGMEEDIFGDD